MTNSCAIYTGLASQHNYTDCMQYSLHSLQFNFLFLCDIRGYTRWHDVNRDIIYVLLCLTRRVTVDTVIVVSAVSNISTISAVSLPAQVTTHAGTFRSSSYILSYR